MVKLNQETINMKNKQIHMLHLKSALLLLLAICILCSSSLLAQDDDDEYYEDTGPYIGLNIGAATWFNQCDVPQAEQSSDLQPAFGPFLSFTYGKFRLETTYFDGRFPCRCPGRYSAQYKRR